VSWNDPTTKETSLACTGYR